MVELGVEGVEAFSNYHSPETVEYFYQAGKKHQILITCGSDYHVKLSRQLSLVNVAVRSMNMILKIN